MRMYTSTFLYTYIYIYEVIRELLTATILKS